MVETRLQSDPNAPMNKRREAATFSFDTVLVDGEKLVYQARISLAIYWKSIVVLVFGVILLFMAFNLGVFFTFIGLSMFAIAALTRYYLLLALTDRRVVVRSGILFLDIIQMRLSQIESVEVSWTIPGQIFNYGSIVVTGTGSRATIIPFISNPQAYRHALDEILLRREAEENEKAAK